MKYLLVLFLFAAHHKHTHEKVTSTIVEPDRAGCDVDSHGIKWWLGEDGMIGFGLTCEDAFQDWRNTGMPRVRHQA